MHKTHDHQIVPEGNGDCAECRRIRQRDYQRRIRSEARKYREVKALMLAS